MVSKKQSTEDGVRDNPQTVVQGLEECWVSKEKTGWEGGRREDGHTPALEKAFQAPRRKHSGSPEAMPL